jgi:hypothetical protein
MEVAAVIGAQQIGALCYVRAAGDSDGLLAIAILGISLPPTQSAVVEVIDARLVDGTKDDRSGEAVSGDRFDQLADFAVNNASSQRPVEKTPLYRHMGLWLPKIVSGLAQMPRWAILASGCLTS